MREELKNVNWHVYNLSLDDYEYTYELINSIIADRNKQIHLKENILEDQNIDFEAMADLNYYAEIENLFLWHFGIWRLQGIFEGILKINFFPKKKLSGLKTKLDYTRKATGKITNQDYLELLEWAKLRNALSHHPPEQYRPSSLKESDFLDYLKLVKRVTKEILATQ